MVGVSGYKPTIPSREANYRMAPGAIWLAVFGDHASLPQQLGARNGGLACPQNYDPVIVDGKIYSNSCHALDQTGRTGRPYDGPRGARKGGWIQKADKSMERRGTEGAFTRQAAAHKMGVQQYAAKVIKEMKKKDKRGQKLSASDKKLLRRAVFARNMGGIAKKRRSKK